MKSIFTFLLFFIFLYSCEKSEIKPISPRLSAITAGGCAVDNYKSATEGNIQQNEVTCTFKNNELNLMVGFEGTCCVKYNTTSETRNDTIFIRITDPDAESCNCICYYTYNFQYRGVFDTCYYAVNINDYHFLNGIIIP